MKILDLIDDVTKARITCTVIAQCFTLPKETDRTWCPHVLQVTSSIMSIEYEVGPLVCGNGACCSRVVDGQFK